MVTFCTFDMIMELLYEDLYFHQDLAFRLAEERAIRIGPTMLGESHIQRRDGVHIEDSARPLLTESLACAIMDLDPHDTYKRARPPHGEFGPWRAPADQGMAPDFSHVAVASPYFFRTRRKMSMFPPLMNVNIP